MKKSLLSLSVIVVSLVAWAAGIEDSALFKAFEDRSLTRHGKFEKLVVKKLALKTDPADITQLKVDENAQTFAYVSLSNRLCKGKIEDGNAHLDCTRCRVPLTIANVNSECTDKYSAQEEQILSAIYKSIGDESKNEALAYKVSQLKMHEDGSFSYVTPTNKLCTGAFKVGQAQTTCEYCKEAVKDEGSASTCPQKYSAAEETTLAAIIASVGEDKVDVTQLKMDQADNSFSYVTSNNKLCKGKVDGGQVIEGSCTRCKGDTVNNTDTKTVCAQTYSAKELEILEAIYLTVSEDRVNHIEIYGDTEKFVFDKSNKEICQGDYVFGKAQYFCFSIDGNLSGFAGGDSD